MDHNRSTREQSQTLLNISHHCLNLLISHQEVGTETKMDPDAVKAASDTYCLAQLQLRHLIDDQARWKIDTRDKVQAEKIKTLKAQRESIRELQRPSRIYSAKVGRFEVEGRHVWLAWIGGPVPTESDLVAEGLSPAHAMSAFDEAFTRLLPKQKRKK